MTKKIIIFKLVCLDEAEAHKTSLLLGKIQLMAWYVAQLGQICSLFCNHKL